MARLPNDSVGQKLEVVLAPTYYGIVEPQTRLHCGSRHKIAYLRRVHCEVGHRMNYEDCCRALRAGVYQSGSWWFVAAADTSDTFYTIVRSCQLAAA